MEPKYMKGQKVRIVSLSDEHLKSKYSHIEEYISQTGVIIKSHWYGVSESYHSSNKRPHVVGHHINDVFLDIDCKIIMIIPEDALEPRTTTHFSSHPPNRIICSTSNPARCRLLANITQ